MNARRLHEPENPYSVMATAFEGLTRLPERLAALEQMIADLQQPDAKELLSVQEACERCSLSDWKIYDLIKRGELRAIKIGSITRIPVTELRRWIAAKLDE